MCNTSNQAVMRSNMDCYLLRFTGAFLSFVRISRQFPERHVLITRLSIIDIAPALGRRVTSRSTELTSVRRDADFGPYFVFTFRNYAGEMPFIIKCDRHSRQTKTLAHSTNLVVS
jgi:hypothetical protein